MDRSFSLDGWTYILVGVILFFAVQCVLFATRETKVIPLQKRKRGLRRRHRRLDQNRLKEFSWKSLLCG